MNIVYLYAELGPYNIPVLNCLVRNHCATIHVISWDKNRLKPYLPPAIEGVSFHKRSEMSERDIIELVECANPDIAYVSGWMDAGYLPAARLLRQRGVPVVTGFDDQWVGNLRQRLGAYLAFPLHYRKYFSHAWVAGARQYEYARRLGFQPANIIFDLLTCDYEPFSLAGEDAISKAAAYPKTFLYVGNLRKVKGTDVLVRAFARYRDVLGGKWRLLCAGNGEMEHLFRNQPGVEFFGFLDQPALVRKCAESGVFVLPSRHDQWGVVVHEFAAAGLPLLLSEGVGAAPSFLIDGFNGTMYRGNSHEQLAERMLWFSLKSDAELMKMAQNSRKLAKRIDPETSAASLVSILRGSH